MSRTDPLPIPWTPRSAPARVTPAKPRIKPTPSGRRRPGAATSLAAAVAVRHGIALKGQGSLQALLDVDDVGFAALVHDGTVLEVPLGAGRRYVLADAVPAAATAEAGAA